MKVFRSTISPKQRAKLIARARAYRSEGYSTIQIARTLGVSSDTVREILK